MVDIKITVDQLKNYLGTGLEILDGWGDVRKLKYTHLDDEGNNGLLFGIKPICYRLSDLDKEIEHNGERFVPAEKLLPHYKKCDYRLSGNILEKLNPKAKNSWGFMYVNIENMKYPDIQKLFEWHFWPFGEEYFEQGLVIDKRKEVSNG